MKHLLYVFLVYFLFNLDGRAQTTGCNCNYTITGGGYYDNAKLKWPAGSTICLKAGHYDMIRFYNFIGTADKKFRFVNCGGQVTIGANVYYAGMQFINSQHFVLSGSGDSTKQYGFYVLRGPNGIYLQGANSDYEIERVQIDSVGYAAIWTKYDPSCDTMSWAQNFSSKNVKIHDNYIRNTFGFGIFIGSGYGPNTTVTCNGVARTVSPVQFPGLEIYNNRLENTLKAAFQITYAPDPKIYNNTLFGTNYSSNSNGMVRGGDCGCDYTILKAGTYDSYNYNVEPGAKVCVKAGRYDAIRLVGFKGTPQKPITFTNCGGQVAIGSTVTTTGFTFSRCSFFKVTGTGSPTFNYGFLIDGNYKGNQALNITDLSTDVEVDHVEIANAGFAGIMAKTDPGCDPATQRANFTMYNVKIHDNYIHDVSGEGLYIGNSFYGTGMTGTCGGVTQQLYPHLIYGLEVYNNRIERTGAEGIQYGCAPDAKIHHNYLKDLGMAPFASYQSNGLQIGGGAGGDVYNNTILNARGNGIIVVGHLGGNRIFNNVIANSNNDGIFCDFREGSVPNTPMLFANNTIDGCGRDGIRLYNSINQNTVVNNAIFGYGKWNAYARPVLLANYATAQQITNYSATTAAPGTFVNPAAGDYRLLAGSPLVNAGTHIRDLGVAFDLVDVTRPQGGTFDIGAYELVQDSATELPGSARLSTELFKTEIGLRTYPSPCREELTVAVPQELGSSRVYVFDVSGQVVAEAPVPDDSKKVSFPAAQWPTGQYTVKVTGENATLQSKIVKL